MKRTLSHIFIPLWMNLGSSCRLKRIYITSGDVYVFLCSVVLSDKIENVSLTYKDQNTAIVYDNTSFTNERQKIEIKVNKKDYDTEVNKS